jgi:hypothetical protein
MRTQYKLLPYVLIAFGAIYLLKPDIFHTFLSRRKPVAEQHAMTPQNRRFMKRLGAIFVLAGLAILIYRGGL